MNGTIWVGFAKRLGVVRPAPFADAHTDDAALATLAVQQLELSSVDLYMLLQTASREGRVRLCGHNERLEGALANFRSRSVGAGASSSQEFKLILAVIGAGCDSERLAIHPWQEPIRCNNGDALLLLHPRQPGEPTMHYGIDLGFSFVAVGDLSDLRKA